MESIFERLTQSNTVLREVLSGASHNLANIETNLTEQVGQFRTALDSAMQIGEESNRRIESQVSLLETTTSKMLADLSDLGVHFDTQRAALEKTILQLADADSQIDINIDERREKLEALASSVAQTASDVDAIMSTYKGLVEDALTAAESRAREIGDSMGKNTAASAQAALDQIDNLRQQTETAVAQASEKARSAIEQTSDKAMNAVEQTSGKAIDAVESVSEQARAASEVLAARLNQIEGSASEVVDRFTSVTKAAGRQPAHAAHRAPGCRRRHDRQDRGDRQAHL